MITSPTTPRRFTKTYLQTSFPICTSFLYAILVPGKDGKFPFQTAVDVDVGNAVDVDVGNDFYVGDDVDVDVGDDGGGEHKISKNI